MINHINKTSLKRFDAHYAKYSKCWDKGQMQKLRNKLKNFYDTLYDQEGELKEYDSVYNTKKAIMDGYETCFNILEKITVYVFMAELIASGLTPEDTLVLMNGSARQNRSMDKHNGDWNKNGYFSDNIAVWKEKLKSLYPN